MALTPDTAVYFIASFGAMKSFRCGKQNFYQHLHIKHNMKLARLGEYSAHMLYQHQAGVCAWQGLEYQLPYGIVYLAGLVFFFVRESQWQFRVTACHIVWGSRTPPLYLYHYITSSTALKLTKGICPSMNTILTSEFTNPTEHIYYIVSYCKGRLKNALPMD